MKNKRARSQMRIGTLRSWVPFPAKGLVRAGALGTEKLAIAADLTPVVHDEWIVASGDKAALLILVLANPVLVVVVDRETIRANRLMKESALETLDVCRDRFESTGELVPPALLAPKIAEGQPELTLELCVLSRQRSVLTSELAVLVHQRDARPGQILHPGALRAVHVEEHGRGENEGREEEGAESLCSDECLLQVIAPLDGRVMFLDEIMIRLPSEVQIFAEPVDPSLHLPELFRGVLEDAPDTLLLLVRLLVRVGVLAVRALIQIVQRNLLPKGDKTLCAILRSVPLWNEVI